MYEPHETIVRTCRDMMASAVSAHRPTLNGARTRAPVQRRNVCGLVRLLLAHVVLITISSGGSGPRRIIVAHAFSCRGGVGGGGGSSQRRPRSYIYAPSGYSDASTALMAVPKRAGNPPRRGKGQDDGADANGAKGKSDGGGGKSKPKRNPAAFTTLSSLSAALAANPDALRDTQSKNRAKPRNANKSGAGGAAAKKKRTRKSVREREQR